MYDEILSSKHQNMMTKELNTGEVLKLIDATVAGLQKLLISIPEENLSMPPSTGGWTAAQVTDHVTKSTTSIAKSLRAPAKPADRDASKRVQEIKTLFLDFTLKFKAAQSILPANDVYDKETLLEGLTASLEDLKAATTVVNLSEAIDVPGFGELTKFELLNLVLYHTQRHVQQIEKIREAITRGEKLASARN